MQKKNYKFLYLLCSLSFMIFVLMTVVHFWSFNEDFYHNEHQKLKLYGKSISEHIGITVTSQRSSRQCRGLRQAGAI